MRSVPISLLNLPHIIFLLLCSPAECSICQTLQPQEIRYILRGFTTPRDIFECQKFPIRFSQNTPSRFYSLFLSLPREIFFWNLEPMCLGPRKICCDIQFHYYNYTSNSNKSENSHFLWESLNDAI